jgi:hypothetical protein
MNTNLLNIVKHILGTLSRLFYEEDEIFNLVNSLDPMRYKRGRLCRR